MDNIKKIMHISTYNFKKWAINPRIYVIFTMAFLYVHSILKPITVFCEKSGYDISLYIFPFIMSHPNSVLLIMFGFTLLLCDAPFIDINQPYIMMRSGRKLWVVGHILYIIFASILYSIVVMLFSIISLTPYIEIGLNWGKVINTFAQTTVAQQHNISIPFSFTICNDYSPCEALLLTIINCSMVATFLGLLIFSLNFIVSRFAGILGAAILILWQVVVRQTWTGFTKFSPVTWVSLAQVDTTGSTLYPTLLYIYIVLLCLIAMLSFISILAVKRCDITVLKTV